MSLFFRTAAPTPERRAITDVPWGDAGRGTRAGVRVTPHAALKMPAMWSSANLLASIVANLPVDVYRGSGASRREVTPQPQLVASPSLKVTRREWTYQAMMSLLLRGNAYGLVLERDALLRPRTVEWLNPSDVSVREDTSISQLVYHVGGLDRPAGDIVHARAFVQPGSAIGLSPVEYHAEALGVGLAAQHFGAQWFGDGGHPTAIFQNKQRQIDPEQASTIKARITSVLRGNREPLVLGADWDYKPIQVSANESQFLEAMGYTDAQIARLYGPGLAEVLGYGSQGSTLTYSNRVDRSLDLLTYAVLPWVNKLEDLLTGLIAQPQEVRYNVKGLLRADPKTQMEQFRVAREIGLHSIDELREVIDEPPLPDGQGQDYAPLKGASTPTAGATGAPGDDGAEGGARSHREANGPQIAPSVTVVNNVPPANVQVEHMDARAILPEQPVPQVTVNVEPTPVTVENRVDVETTPVTVQPSSPTPVLVNVEPAEVTVLPSEPRTRKVVRDAKGNIVAVREE